MVLSGTFEETDMEKPYKGTDHFIRLPNQEHRLKTPSFAPDAVAIVLVNI